MRKKIFMILLSIALIVTMMPLSSYAASSGSVVTGKCGANATYTFDGETFEISGSGEAGIGDSRYIKTSYGGYWYYNDDSFREIKYLSIGKNITSVEIDNCHLEKLEAIYVDDGNTSYKSDDGVLFSKDGTQLIAFPAGKTLEASTYTIPRSVTKVCENAFYGCLHVENIVFEEGTQIKEIGYSAFEDCHSLKKITLPESITKIGSYAFGTCEALSEVTLPEGLTVIGNFAFNYCKSLETILIPANVTSIGYGAFARCFESKDSVVEAMTAINVADGNTAYKSIDGVLFSKDGTQLIAFPAGKTLEASTYTIPRSVTEVCEYAFSGCLHVENIVFEEGTQMKEIGYNAFEGCHSLKKITLPESITKICTNAFADCESLASISIPASVTSIGTHVFGLFYDEYEEDMEESFIKEINVDEGNQTYKSIDGVLFSKDGTELIEFPDGKKSENSSYTVPKSVTRICEFAFRCNLYIENIVFEEDSQLKEIGNFAFVGCYSLKSTTLPESLEKIGNYAFRYCKKLKSVIFQGNQVTTIGRAAFEWCGALESIEIPEGVTTISKDAFYGCSSLSNVTLPDTIKKIKENAFRECGVLQTINLPEGITEIGNRVFQDCKKLENVTLPTSLKTLGALAFYNTGVKNITIPSGLTSIEPETFAYTSLETVTLPNNVRSVGYSAFMNCSNLASVTLPSTVRDINYATFKNCLNLTKINLENAENVRDVAFSGCESLKSISITDNTKSLGYKAFDIPNLTVTFTGTKIPTSLASFATSAKLKGACDAEWTDELKNNYNITLVHSYSDGTCIKCGKAEEKGSYSGGGGGGAIVIPVTSEDVANKAEDKAAGTSATTTATVKSTTTTSKDGTKTSSATIDTTTANKIVEKAVENKSEVVVIDTAGSTSSADTATGTNTEITIPAQTVAQIVEKTGAEVIIKTSNAEVNLDKKTVEEVSKQAGTTGDVKLVVKTVEQSANKAQFELKLVTSSGTVTNFNGGEVSVTVKLNKSLANKPVICVYIDDYGRYHKVSGKKNADGTFTFTTGHFSSYAVMTEEEADKVIAEQVEEVKTLAEKIKLKASSVKTPKGNIKVTLKAKEGASSITSLQELGYTIKYKFYRSTKKSAGYKAKVEKKSRTYINTQGKSGTRYYYKARVMVYDSEGNLVTKTTLKNCTYATRKK